MGFPKENPTNVNGQQKIPIQKEKRANIQTCLRIR